MKIGPIVAATCLSACLAGCGMSIPGFSTSSLGGKTEPVVQNDPTSRAFQVATTSARAVKCGYNFDAGKLRYQYLASETAANPQDAEKIAQTYDATFNGVTKAIASQPGYCSGQKTGKIREALNRHLDGDYAPSPPEKTEEEGLFSGWGGGSSSSKGVKTPLPGSNDE